MKKQKKSLFIIIGVSISVILLLFLPFLLNEFIFGNNYVSKVTNDGWASFFGSYIGGAIGGIGTLIAVYITVRQNLKQTKDAEYKERTRKRIEEANEIATLVANYLSDLQIFLLKEKEYNNKFQELIRDSDYNSLLSIFKWERKNRYFDGFRSYRAMLQEKQISTEYLDRFINSYDGDGFTKDKMFDEYEKGLENIISATNLKLDSIKETQNENMQKFVIGNNSFMLLDIKLENMDKSQNLSEALNRVQSIMIKENPFYFGDIKKKHEASIDAIDKLKKEVRIFIKSFVQG